MAIANIYTQDDNGLLTHELQTGQVYSARSGGYGIIVIEDTMSPVIGRPIGTFKDGDLVVLLAPVNRYEVAPSHLAPLAPTTQYHTELLLRPVDLPVVGVQIIVSTPG